MARRAEARVFREVGGGMSLQEIAHCCGALPPAAVCRLGRQVALALVERHERALLGPHGGVSLDCVRVLAGGQIVLLDAGRPPERSLSPERRASGGRSVDDDLWALGVLLADLALAGAVLEGDRLSEANPALPARLRDALDMLVAPPGERLTNASAAVRMLTEVEKDFGDGALLVRAALARTRGVDAAALTGPRTASMAPDRVLSASAVRALNDLALTPTLPDVPPTPAPLPMEGRAPALPPPEVPRWVVPAILAAIVVVVVVAVGSALF